MVVSMRGAWSGAKILAGPTLGSNAQVEHHESLRSLPCVFDLSLMCHLTVIERFQHARVPSHQPGSAGMSNSHHNNSHNHHHFKKKFVFGTPEDDVLNGTNRDDIMFGFKGDDEIAAGNGNDTVFAGRGDDHVDAGAGNDTVFAGHGDDHVEGGAGNDDLHGEEGDDLVEGGTGNDDVDGGSGNDGLAGGDGNDELEGGHGRDFIVSGAGRDKMEGGQGQDKFVIRPGTGVDTVEDLHSNDRLDLRDFNFASGEAVIAAFQQRGRDAVLDLGNGDKVILKDTRVSELEAEQFIVSDAATGPTSSQSPYVLGVDAKVSTVSLLTVGDQTEANDGWQMVGIPDGLGAFDNGDGTFTVLMNHELALTQGAVRAHGATGAFVSKLVIDKDTLEVQSGSDLIQHVFLYDTATNTYYDPVTDGNPLTNAYAFDRLCSADLADLGAFYNADSGLGYNGRIFMNGEETGPPFSPVHGKAFAHFVDGAEAGNSYEIPWLGKMSFENSVANPNSGDTTMIACTDDATPGQVYFYFGEKQATGSAIEKAGLVGGSLWGVRVADLIGDADNETNATTLGGDYESAFSLVNLGDVSEISGATLQTNSETAHATEFLRPEDGAWSTVDPDIFYFTTTNAFGSPSRLWAMEFNDPTNPNAGGTIHMLLDGSEGQQMLDNMTVTDEGKILLQEDVGNNAHIGKIWEYDPATDTMTVLAQHDPSRFLTGGSNFITQDEESSGIIDVTDILGNAGQNVFLFDVQSHNNLGGALVQGGQLGLLYQDLI
jgi:hypothetical protein